MSRLIKLVIIACCLFMATGCSLSSRQKEMPENAQRTLTMEEIKKADASFLNEKSGAGKKQTLPADLPRPPATSQEPEKPLESEEKDTIGQSETEDTTMFTSAPPPPDNMKTDKQSGSTNQDLTAIDQRLKNLEAYSQKTRDLAGENRHLLRRVLPDTNTVGLTGYKNGQRDISQAQKKWLEENIVRPYLAGKIYDLELTGYADTTPVKKGAKYTLDDFPELRIKEIVNYIKERGADVANIKILKGRVTDEFGNNRRVQFDYKTK